MELTAQTLREVEFREKLRGYHPDDVDDFLEEAAVALEDLLERLHHAESRSGPVPMPSAEGGGPPGGAGRSPFVRPDAADETRAAPSGPATTGAGPSAPLTGGVTEQTLQRTLLLAQQTADAAIADAKETAKRIVEEAHAEARRITEEAQARAAEVRGQAESRASQSLAELEEQRSGLEHEVIALRSWAVQQRDRLRDALTDQVRSLDTWLAASAPPAVPAAADPAQTPAQNDPAPPPASATPAELVDHEAEPDWLNPSRDPAAGSEGPSHPAEAAVQDDPHEPPSGGLFRRR